MSDPAPPAARPWRLRRRIGRSFIALAVLFTVLGAVVVISAVKFAIAGNDVISRWQPATSASQRVLADLVNQETGVRGYLLTGQQLSLQPYTDYLSRQRADTARVRSLAEGDPAITRGLAAVERAANRWRAEIATPLIAEVKQGRRPDESALDAGQAQFDKIRAASARLTATLMTKTRDARADRTVTGVFAGVALGIGLLVIIAAAIALWRGLGRWVLAPVDRLAAQTRQVASGELNREIVPDGPVELTGLGVDVEVMRAQIVDQLAAAKRSQEQLERKSAELESSNNDLQQFAYVASHDLSEPLRKVANFCQLLERQYADQLDERARQYIAFAVDGAKRMQILIADLLALSRVGRDTAAFVAVDTATALDDALATLADRIAAAGTRIERLTPLPTVPGDRTLLTSLFENVIGNAVKYHRDDVPPVVEIGAALDPEAKLWTFTVRDNGIGIDPQYAERIFTVFQRLHLRDRYGGTGIGLALARKIVDHHGGSIGLDPVQSSPGATFTFTLPEGDAGA